MNYEIIDLLKIIDHKDMPARQERNNQEIARILEKLLSYENTTGVPTNDTVIDNKDTWTDAATNFNDRNDRIATVPANPIIAGDGTAVDHVLNTDGSCDMSFEWSFSGVGDAYDIDGFIVYIRSSNSPDSYTFGTTPAEETVYFSSKDKRSIILSGVAADKYYTFGVQAYRMVDNDINADGILKSGIIQPSLAAENPYRPAENVAFNGDISGTVTGNIHDSDHPSGLVVNILDGFGSGCDGAFNSVENITLTVDSEDASSVVKQYSSFTLNAGHTLTVDKRCRGLFLFVQGDVAINGTINMDGKAAKVSKASSLQRILQIPVGVYILDVPSGGAAGAGGKGGGGGRRGAATNAGGAGGEAAAPGWFGGGFGGAGGGGGGGVRAESTYNHGGGNGGGNDLDLAVGNGGGGGPFRDSYDDSGNTLGGTGGNLAGGGGGGACTYEYYVGDGVWRYDSGGGGGGGAGLAGGNPGASGHAAAASAGGVGGIGGGTVVIIAGGNITINPGGAISANGQTGGAGGAGGNASSPTSNEYSIGGGGGGGQGGGGGGVVVLAYRGALVNSGSITVNGGTGGPGGAGGTATGGTSNYPGTSGTAGSSGSVGTIIAAQV